MTTEPKVKLAESIMVIANSDSNTTLVSLDNGTGGLNDKLVGGEQQKIVIDPSTGLLRYAECSASSASHISDDNETFSHDGGVATELLISHADGSSSEEHVPLYLPLNELDASSEEKHQSDIDRYISRNYYNIDNDNDENNEGPFCCLPGSQVLKASRDRLLTSKRRRRDQDRLLYVAQGERANATSDQYSVLMSDKATTCHILAFHSRTNSTRCKRSLPMASLTHLDGPHYEQCVRDMIQEHLDHHRSKNPRNQCRRKRKFAEEEKKSDCEAQDESTESLIENVTIDIHLMGGFDDDDSSSSSITEWLLRLLARVAKEFKDQRIGVQMVMKTLVVSSSNNKVDDHNNNCPIGRGLGIDLYTGRVFLTDTQNDSSSSGPVSVLRSVRLWSRGCEPNESHRLSVVHTSKDVDDLWTSIGYGRDNVIRKEYSLFWVQPFRFRSIPDVDVLLRLPNEILLQYTSTSPEVEEAGFCKDVRASMAFLKHQCETMNVDGSSYFGEAFDRPMVFVMRRSSGKSQREEWRRLSF